MSAATAPYAPLSGFCAYMRFWYSRLASTSPNQMLMVAIGWQIYDLTGSAWDPGGVGLLQFLPALLLVLVAGHVIDCHHLARIVGLCMLAQTAIALLLAASTQQQAASRELPYVMSVLLGTGAVAICGVATIVFGFSTSFIVSFIALIVAGADDMVSAVIRQSLVQLDTPDTMRGRVSAVNSVFIGASNQLGEFESGVTAALLGPVASVVLGGLGTLLVAGLWFRRFPPLANRDALPSPH